MDTHQNGDAMILTSGPASRLAGVTPETLRAWSDRGWLPYERAANGMRLYQPADVRRLAAARAGIRETKGTR